MRALPLALAVALLIPALPAHAGATDVFLPVPGGTAHGLLALPAGECKGTVVIAHGYGHPAANHTAHLEHLADEGFVAIAMDYRGPLTGFPLRAGATDTIAGARFAESFCPGKPVDLYSVSMGTAVASMVLAEHAVFRYWVTNEGLSALAETWAGATVLAPVNAFAKTASEAIVTECGGTPAQQPGCYAERSAAYRAPEYAYLKGVILTHGLNDGLVPYDQGREMAAALRAVGVPADFHTVVRGNAGGEGTTLTGYAGQNPDGLAGHGSEANDAHTLTELSFRLLDDLILGRTAPPADREFVHDRDMGTLP